MFCDERIILEKGKIYRKLYIIASIVALVYLVARIGIYLNSSLLKVFSLFSTEIFTILSSVIVISYGEIAYRVEGNDERSINGKYNYYSKSGKFVLVSILLGYAVSMIAVPNRLTNDFPTNSILITFELIGFMFFYYQYKKNNININQSFIAYDKKQYYLYVMKLIGYLALIIIGIYFGCATISFIIYQEIAYLLAFLIAGIISIISIGLQYLFISFIEKIDYDDEINRVKKSFLIVGIVSLIFLLSRGISISLYYHITLNGHMTELGKFAQTTSLINRALTIISNTYIAISLTYLMSYFSDSKLLKRSILVYFILIAIGELLNICLSAVLCYLDNIDIIHEISYIFSIINYIQAIFVLIDFLIIVYSLVKNNYDKKILIIPITRIIVFLVGLFLSTQGNNANVIRIILEEIVTFVSWLLLFILLYTTNKIIKKDDIY